MIGYLPLFLENDKNIFIYHCEKLPSPKIEVMGAHESDIQTKWDEKTKDNREFKRRTLKFQAKKKQKTIEILR